MNSRTQRTSALLSGALFLSFLTAGCFGGHKNVAAKNPASQNEEPDKILYDRALNDYQHGRYTESRLALQTLINSYPDSAYLAKAKLAVADSYYKQGGIDGLTQAVAEYKDFITFFPFLPEAAYAQMQVGMAHYRMMGKPDRDNTQAKLAEQEFQTFLLTYPKSPLVPTAEQRLREVQEVLAQGDFDIAHFYYVKGDYRAAAARLIEVAQRYPLFSQTDKTYAMLGDIFRRAAKGAKNKEERARLRAQSDAEFAQVIKECPLSPLVPEAKRELAQDHVAIPKPDPQALERAEYDAKFAHDHPGIFGHILGVVRSSPNVSMAARIGEPDLNPPGENGAEQNGLPGTMSAGSNVGTSAGTQTAVAQTVAPDESAGSSESSAKAALVDPPNGPAGNVEPASNDTTETDIAAAKMSKTDEAAATEHVKKAKGKKAKAPKINKSKESTSKHKKGIHKLIPW